ncbi:MAG: hypothetical protein QS748_11665 [Candidatus Endonucleobacter bathymodioli]|uniref:Uncharacterized protein n=1 Tax=Candidatus Endonucleibacter bathymodioli TaxID=539814 RepID=A0AA90STN3_9GAMM|nr:hypothetical protein [Candidatus Endonucleobacter bathymodioli]
MSLHVVALGYIERSQPLYSFTVGITVLAIDSRHGWWEVYLVKFTGL